MNLSILATGNGYPLKNIGPLFHGRSRLQRMPPRHGHLTLLYGCRRWAGRHRRVVTISEQLERPITAEYGTGQGLGLCFVTENVGPAPPKLRQEM